MRTTIDIPDTLLRRAKAIAALRGVKLKELLASFIEQGLARSVPTAEHAGHPEPLPEFIPRTGHTVPLLTSAEVEAILLREEPDSTSGNRRDAAGKYRPA